MSMTIRENINIGSTFMKSGKKYVVTGIWYEMGGMFHGGRICKSQ